MPVNDDAKPNMSPLHTLSLLPGSSNPLKLSASLAHAKAKPDRL